MGFVGNLAKQAAKSAATSAVSKAKHKANGGCKGSEDGKHLFRGHKIQGHDHVVIYCHNPGCGQAQ